MKRLSQSFILKGRLSHILLVTLWWEHFGEQFVPRQQILLTLLMINTFFTHIFLSEILKKGESKKHFEYFVGSEQNGAVVKVPSGVPCLCVAQIVYFPACLFALLPSCIYSCVCARMHTTHVCVCVCVCVNLLLQPPPNPSPLIAFLKSS